MHNAIILLRPIFAAALMAVSPDAGDHPAWRTGRRPKRSAEVIRIGSSSD